MAPYLGDRSQYSKARAKGKLVNEARADGSPHQRVTDPRFGRQAFFGASPLSTAYE